MRFIAKSKFVLCSPYKLRPIVDVIRGSKVSDALAWLTACRLRRSISIKKLVESVAANARHLENVEPGDLVIEKIIVDHGPSYKYFKPGAMGRAKPQTRRKSHMEIVVKQYLADKEA